MQTLTNSIQRLLCKTSPNHLLQTILPSSTQLLFQSNNHFLRHNEKIYPIQMPDEERRPAFVCHVKKNLKYSPKKMWYVANLVRGMTIDDALKQISFVMKKGAIFVKEALLEAQKLAVDEHNVEFRSNLWVSESFVTKGQVIKGIRKHAKARIGEIRYVYCHYYVTLEEGKPPEHYYHYRAPKTKEQLLNEYMEYLRGRKVHVSL